MFFSLILSLSLILVFFLLKKIWANFNQKKESAELYERLSTYLKNRKERLDSFKDPKYDFPQKFIDSILNADATDLIEKLNRYEVTSEQLLNVYLSFTTNIKLLNPDFL